MTSRPPSMNLPEWLTELRKTIHSLDREQIIKALSQEQPDGSEAEGRGRVQSSSPLGEPLSPVSPRAPPAGKFSEACPAGFLGWCHHLGMID